MNPIDRYRTTKQQRGLTLIEILVAVLILSVGLLGLAGLQVMGLKNISLSGTHANAAILANELAERIHVNEDNIDRYVSLVSPASISDTNDLCPSTASIALMDYCSVYTKATGDLNNDGDLLDTGEKQLLRPSPDGTALITITTCGACTGANMHTISFNWAERDYAGVDQERTYQLHFTP